MAGRAPKASDRTRRITGAWHSLKSADFAAVLAAPALRKSEHFVLHHLAQRPLSSLRRADGPDVQQLSTDDAPNGSADVDKALPPAGWWLGLVVPKRHARRSVTRSLIKREMRAQADGQRSRLAAGQWIIRLRMPFDVCRFPSAASDPLRQAARDELERMFASAVRP